MPRLMSAGGPLGQAVYTIDGDVCVLGRDTDTQICLPLRAVSRRHCTIHRKDDGFHITDLDSRNGVSVNGIKIKDCLLQDRDRIDICDFSFIFSQEADPGIEPAIPAVTIPHERLFHLEPPGSQVLFQMRSLFAAADRPEFDRLLLDLARSFIPAQVAAIVMAGEEAPGVSRGVIEQVLRDRSALLISGEQEAIKFPTLRNSPVRSVIAAPILAWDLDRAGLSDDGPALGAIYMANDSPGPPLDESKLELLAAIAVAASSALEHQRVFGWLQRERERLEQESGMLCRMVGHSQPMQDLFAMVRRVAASDAGVVILGESGSGKELVAQAIHQLSRRASRPFVALNCAALAETLLETEMFGHERGAFTGALAQKQGKLELAEGGVLFLDEIGEMSPLLQAKLLRVLQERQFERVGGTRTLRLNARVIAATNRELMADVRAGRFREDLYFRLSVVTVRTPPLRERKSDILTLAHHFLRQHAPQAGREVLGFSPRAQRLLLRYDWPGNVRELANAVERAVALGAGPVVRPEDLGLAAGATAEPEESGRLHTAVMDAKRAAVSAALAECAGNVRCAAQALGVNPRYLHRLINQLGLAPRQARGHVER